MCEENPGSGLPAISLLPLPEGEERGRAYLGEEVRNYCGHVIIEKSINVQEELSLMLRQPLKCVPAFSGNLDFQGERGQC